MVIWRFCLAIGALVVTAQATTLAQAPRFYPDDPLRREADPVPVVAVQRRALSEVWELVKNTFRTQGQRHPKGGVIPAIGVNTLGDVMDGEWYVNRHATRRMTIEELQRGPGIDSPPATGVPWQVLVVKPFGVNPGLLVADAKNDLYVLRFDPPGYAGLATGAEMVTSRFLHALGYHVAENYLVRFERSQLAASQTGQAVSSAGHLRALVAADIDMFLRRVPGADGTYRAVATRLPDRRETLLGPFQVWGTRSDDPNDTVPHEHRRELRGLYVFAAWLNHSSARAVGTQDILVTVNGVPRIRHFLIDFTRSLGSGTEGGPKLVWEGNEPRVPELAAVRRNIASMGIVTPPWMKARYPGLPEVGAFEAQTFDPASWSTNHPIAPFANRLADDTFWAARQVMAFTDAEIRAIVQTGQYSQPAEDWITRSLVERRNRIGRTFFARVLPLARFRVAHSTLEFDDLGVVHGMTAPRQYAIEWYRFDNASDALGDSLGTGAALPAGAQTLGEGAYLAARVHAGDAGMNVTVFLRRRSDGFDIVGLDRAWPDKAIAPPAPVLRTDPRAFTDLVPQQRVLFATYSNSYNAARGSRYTPEQGFSRLSVSEQSTYYAITHALMHSTLTDARGASLGTALDRIESIERIAGQAAGRSGDEQFRLFVNLKPDTREVLDKSQQFFRDSENTVYHAGYPHSYRQAGKEPNVQFSLSDDGLSGDIDVDYRSSRSPQGLFNGHLTSANSDVRVGDNAQRHNGRWNGLIAWWQDTFGRLKAPSEEKDLLNLDRPEAPSTAFPPDRPAGAAPQRIEDAAQEFLTDWLVRRQYDQALEFLSSRAYACLNLNDEAGAETLDAGAARRELRRLMEYATTKMGRRANLTSATVDVTPRDPKVVIAEHPFRQEFLLTPLAEAAARPYFCDQAVPATGAEYFGVVFRFRIEGGGVLGLLWTRESGTWKLVAYRTIAQ